MVVEPETIAVNVPSRLPIPVKGTSTISTMGKYSNDFR